jgi:hypothetical protein
MKKRQVTFFIIGTLVLLFGIGLGVHYIEEQDFFQKGNNPPKKVDFMPASNPMYKNTCGGCHFPYPPGLLPGASWKSLLDRLENHFGEQISIEPKAREEILAYLMENGADRIGTKKSIKIMNSLNGQIPLRITEVPILQKKHRGIKPEVLSRKAIGSLSNCLACHTMAVQGIFHEDFVKIPD